MNRYNDFVGARWWKFDFHTHTPASSDYGRSDKSLKSRTPEEWLLDHMKAKIDCVAVTDHNSGEWIDKLKTAYTDLKNSKHNDFRKIFIFPGVEISISGNIHLLIILDMDKTGSDISSILGACGYTGEKGKTDDLTEKSLIEVLKKIDDFEGIPIPAHVDKKRGLFTETQGTTLKNIIKSPELYACELININYDLPELYKSEKAKWSFISGSDSHKPDEVGKDYTWVKMGKPSLEGLKLALTDGEYFSLIHFQKVKTKLVPNTYSNFAIKNLEIKNAKYCGNGERSFCLNRFGTCYRSPLYYYIFFFSCSSYLFKSDDSCRLDIWTCRSFL